MMNDNGNFLDEINVSDLQLLDDVDLTEDIHYDASESFPVIFYFMFKIDFNNEKTYAIQLIKKVFNICKIHHDAIETNWSYGIITTNVRKKGISHGLLWNFISTMAYLTESPYFTNRRVIVSSINVSGTEFDLKFFTNDNLLNWINIYKVCGVYRSVFKDIHPVVIYDFIWKHLQKLCHFRNNFHIARSIVAAYYRNSFYEMCFNSANKYNKLSDIKHFNPHKLNQVFVNILHSGSLIDYDCHVQDISLIEVQDEDLKDYIKVNIEDFTIVDLISIESKNINGFFSQDKNSTFVTYLFFLGYVRHPEIQSGGFVFLETIPFDSNGYSLQDIIDIYLK